MINIIKKIFRYPLSTIFLLFGLIIAFICVFCGYAIFNYTCNLKMDIKKYNYKSTAYIGIDASKSLEGININKIKTSMGNSMFNDVEVRLGNDEKIVLANILVDINEKLLYRLENGRLINKDDINSEEKVVNVGRNIVKYSYKKNGERYIKINGDEYKIIGVIGTKNSKLQDNKVILYYDCLGDRLINELSKCNDVVYSISSNKTKKELIRYESEKIKNKLATDSSISLYEYEENTIINNNNRKLNEIVFFMLYFLGVLNCIIVSEFWLLNRKNEIVIRLAFGFNEKMLFKILYNDILNIATLAAFFGIIFSKIIESILNNTLEMVLNFSIINCIVIMLFVLVTTYILTKILLRRIFSKNINDYIMIKGVD